MAFFLTTGRVNGPTQSFHPEPPQFRSVLISYRRDFALVSLRAPKTSFSKALPRRWRKPPRQPRFHFLLNSMIYLKDTFITHRKTTTSLRGPLNVPAQKCFLTLSPASSPCHASCPLQRRREEIHDHAAHHFRNKKIERLRAQALWRSIFSFLRHSAVKAETEHPVVGGFFTFSRGAVPNLRERAV